MRTDGALRGKAVVGLGGPPCIGEGARERPARGCQRKSRIGTFSRCFELEGAEDEHARTWRTPNDAENEYVRIKRRSIETNETGGG